MKQSLYDILSHYPTSDLLRRLGLLMQEVTNFFIIKKLEPQVTCKFSAICIDINVARRGQYNEASSYVREIFGS